MADIEYCDECGAERLTVERRADLRMRFETAHKKGAEQFGRRWLTVNQCAVDAAAVLNIDTDDMRIRALLSETCYRILAVTYTAKEVGTL